MERKDTERVARLLKEAVELGATLLLTPLKLLLRNVLPGSTPMDREAPSAVEQEPPAGDVAATPVATSGPGPELHVQPPWDDYETMTVGEILARLTGADPATRAMVRLFEETHRNRKGVLRATE